jgi:hypothetical protein
MSLPIATVPRYISKLYLATKKQCASSGASKAWTKYEEHTWTNYTQLALSYMVLACPYFYSISSCKP